MLKQAISRSRLFSRQFQQARFAALAKARFYSSRAPPKTPQPPQQAPKQTTTSTATPIEAEEVLPHTPVEITSAQVFQEQLQANANKVILLDCYADWCQPCKSLSPILDKVVQHFAGQVTLFKLNIDNVPEVAEHFQIQAVPTLFLIAQGRQVVSTISGFREEPFLRDWVGKVVKAVQQQQPQQQQLQQQQQQSSSAPRTPEQTYNFARQQLESGNHDTAAQLFGTLINDKSATEFHPKSYAGLIMCALGRTDFEASDKLIATVTDQFPSESRTEPELLRAFALTQITKQYNALQGSTNVEIEANLLKELQQDSNNHETRLKLAIAYFSHGKYQDAVNELLNILKKNPKWQEGAARKTLILMFDSLGSTHKITIEGRKRLANLLF